MWTVMYAFPDKVLTRKAVIDECMGCNIIQWQWHTKHKQSITTTRNAEREMGRKRAKIFLVFELAR